MGIGIMDIIKPSNDEPRKANGIQEASRSFKLIITLWIALGIALSAAATLGITIGTDRNRLGNVERAIGEIKANLDLLRDQNLIQRAQFNDVRIELKTLATIIDERLPKKH